MRIQQFIKSLNNTEIGKGGTHESYVLVSKKVKNIENIFDLANHKPSLINLKNGGTVDSVHITTGREFRINGLGDFYRTNNVNAGDEIIFERRDIDSKTDFFINLRVKSNVVIFQKHTKGFMVLNIDRLSPKLTDGSLMLQANYNGKSNLVNITFKESSPLRSDSPEATDFYTIIIDGKDISGDLKNNEYLEFEFFQNKNSIKKVLVWQEYSINV